MFERNRFLISVSLSLLILAFIGLTISSFSPTEKSDEYFDLETAYQVINNYKVEVNDWESSENTLIDLNYWYDYVPRYDKVSNKDYDVNSLQNKTWELIIKHQIKALPEIRKCYGEYLRNKFESLGYKVTILNDERNKIIVFTHNSFKNRGSLEQFHVSVTNDLRLLGFKQIRYKWYELEELEDEKYIHYNFKDLADNEIRRFNISTIKK